MNHTITASSYIVKNNRLSEYMNKGVHNFTAEK